MKTIQRVILIMMILFIVVVLFLFVYNKATACSKLAKKLGPTIVADFYSYNGSCLLKINQPATADKVSTTAWVSVDKIFFGK